MKQREKIHILFTLPMVILFLIFHTYPLIRGLLYSVTNFKGYGSFDFVGLSNYIELFKDERVLNSYLFTFKFAIVCTIAVNLISMCLALVLDAKIKGKNFFRGLYFLPNILGGLIVGYIFSYIFSFIVPAFGKMIGSETLSVNILGSTSLAWIGVVIVVAWQSIAFNTIIYISGLATVPEDVYEAGAIDGATKWKRFWKLTFPLIAPFFTINMVLCMRNFLMVFDQIMSLTSGGPAQSTESISLLIYKAGMTADQFGYQSANSVIYFVVIVLISLFQMKVLNKREVQL